ncbi:MAG TPA: cyclic nucleotide-binding domain-containing protein [Acetobacteraceae bacterium]|jgi:CRP/FNR family transcriptional activator FtrB
MGLRPDAIKKIPLFSQLDNSLLIRIGSVSTVVAVPAGEVLLRRGEVADSLNFLLEGRVTLSGAAIDGSSAIVDVLQPVSGVAIATVLGDLPCPISAQAVVASLLLIVAAGPLRTLISRAPSLAGAVLREVASDFGALMRQVLDLKLRSTPQRLGCYLLEQVEDPQADHADFRLPFDKGLLAARLGCRQENLSRAFATLRDVGVETHGARVTLHDVMALRNYALPDAPVGEDGMPL